MGKRWNHGMHDKALFAIQFAVTLSNGDLITSLTKSSNKQTIMIFTMSNRACAMKDSRMPHPTSNVIFNIWSIQSRACQLN